MNIIRNLLFFIFIFCLCFFISAKEPVGEITYLEGVVEITRDGDSLTEDQIEIGTEIENYDFIKTAGNGTVTIELNTKQTPGVELTISPNTVFSLEVDKIQNKKKTSINIITGSLALKVQKITGEKSLDVNTESANMGVRGTNFTVETSPGGDLLVGCDEGRVECVSASKKKLYAEPGTIVEYEAGKDLRNVPVAVTELKNFRKNWIAEKITVFKSDALRAIKQYAGKYDELYGKFNDSYATLVKQNSIINKWSQEDEKGIIGSTMELLSEKKKLISPLLNIRKNLVIFEKIYYRLVELKEYYKQGYGKGTIKTGLTTDDFFGKFERERKELEKKMAVVKYVVKMFSTRNEGTFAADGLSGESDDFFDSIDDMTDFN